MIKTRGISPLVIPNPASVELQETYTLITGASKGLGKEMAREYARRGRNLILVALPGDGVKEFSAELERLYGIRVVFYECDLADEPALETMARWVIDHFSVDQLVNNAGIGGATKFEDAACAGLDRIIHINIRATTMLTSRLLPLLKRHSKALILNVASLAAFGPLPYKTIYPASKAFIYSFSRALCRELRGTGVRVVVLAPGPFISNPDVAGRIMKHGRLAKLGVLTAKQISRQAVSGAERGRKVIIPGFWNKVSRRLMHWAPEYLLLSLMSKAIEKELP
jgi:hypothetical protein